MPIIMRVMALFSTSFFTKCLRVGEDGPGRRHLCNIDTFLVLGYDVVFRLEYLMKNSVHRLKSHITDPK